MFKRYFILNKIKYLHGNIQYHNLQQFQLLKFNDILSNRDYDNFKIEFISKQNDITIQDRSHLINQVKLEKDYEINSIYFYIIYGSILTLIIHPEFIIPSFTYCYTDSLFHIRKLDDINSYLKLM